MEHIFSMTENTISVVIIVISTIGFDEKKAQVIDYHCKLAKF